VELCSGNGRAARGVNVIVVKAIKPATLKKDVFRLEFLTGLHDIEKPIVKDHNKTTDTWKGEKPEFKSAISLKQPGPTLVVEPSGGSPEGVKKWNWLNKGTKVRYAVMSPDFRPKTRTRFIGSGAGRGKMLFVSKKHPMPGIKAREWTEEITRIWMPKFKRRMEQAMQDAARKSGHGTR
jgi:hypothetical protein